MPTPIVGGNWKMNTTASSAKALAAGVAAGIPAQGVDVAIFPPFPYLPAVGAVLREAGSKVLLGAQNFYPERSGAFTGEVSLEMLADCDVSIVLVGHSERRHVIHEPDDLIAAKARTALGASSMTCVLCIGETLEQRQAGQTDAINERQLRSALAGVTPDHAARLVVAYEPVWAIGTGVNATPNDARQAHAHIRRVLEDLLSADTAAAIRIQYGGSVKSSNARELFSQPGIDGGLIGGASLKVEDFCAIVNAAVPSGPNPS